MAEQFSERYNLNYSILATPSECLESKFLKRDKMKFGIIPGITDKKEYTNSNFIPELSIDTLEEKARIEGPYHELTKGGNLFSAEILKPEANTPENIQNLVDLMDKYNIGYAKVEIKQ